MRSETPSVRADGPKQPLKFLLWLALVCGLVGFLEAGEVVDDILRVARNRAHPSTPSGEIVFVAIDDRSMQELGAWPWPRTRVAELLNRTTDAEAKNVFVQILLDDRSEHGADLALARAIERAGSVTLPVVTRQGTGLKGEKASSGPMPLFARHARLATVSLFYNYQQAVWRAPFASSFDGQPIAGMAAAASGKSALPTGGMFRLDYSIDPTRIVRISAADLLARRVPLATLRDKTVVIGPDAEELGDRVWVPGKGRMSGAYTTILGAETLKRGTPKDLGFAPALLIALLLCGLAIRARNRRWEDIPLVLGFVLLLALPILLEANLIFVDVFAGLAALGTVTARTGWRRWRAGGLVNSETGLPNLAALREARANPDHILVAARVHNYAEIASTLDDQGETELARQILQRLSIADRPLRVYQGDEGIFAWFAERNMALADHLEALHTLFRTPVQIAGRPVDIAVTFGVELGSSRANASRLGSALVAANEAWDEGLRWKYHDPARQEEASWRLSLLGELDAAIDRGQVWIAYQPQYDIRSGKIIGAEALARWTHPDKGPISPAEFVSAAEQQGRIAKLTDFVLERAVSTAAALNRRGIPFTVAVNISPRLLADRDLVARIQRSLAKHDLAPERLTLELTETESLQGADGGLSILNSLRNAGVRIAIDDYGTGLSTLEYLRKIPASEIKIDQSFIKAMKTNRSDLIMVQSTIALAHSLGRTVVAEGVEERATIEQLTKMGCDVVQGYAIGRPMGVRELVQSLPNANRQKVA
jgi:EAL domain-containing protein (putative c-di-GMP-specific phosphodiesterase class I)/CHASE2 domain-containing sensor protein